MDGELDIAGAIRARDSEIKIKTTRKTRYYDTIHNNNNKTKCRTV